MNPINKSVSMVFLKWGQSDQSVPIGSNYFFLQGFSTDFGRILEAFGLILTYNVQVTIRSMQTFLCLFYFYFGFCSFCKKFFFTNFGSVLEISRLI